MTEARAPRTRRLLLWLPWGALAAWVGWLAVDVVRAKRLEDPAWVASRVDGVDAHREARHEPVRLAAPDPTIPRRVWVLGSSTIVPRTPGLTEHPLRTSLRAAGIEALVDDLALDGLPSWDEVARLQDAWAEADRAGITPDLIVFYGECNDVTYTFHLGLELPHFDALTGLAWLASGEAFAARADDDHGHTYWHFAHRRAPVILKALQQAGLLHLDGAAFQPFRDRVHRVFEEDVAELIERAREVPVLLVPPVGDLEAEPYGPLATTTDVWAAALALPDGKVRWAQLTAARDAETFTPDMRVDSAMTAAMHALGDPLSDDGPEGVRTCDLAGWLRDHGGPIRHDRFVDPVHLDEVGYGRVIDGIAHCVQDVVPVTPPAPTDGAP